MSLFRQLLVYAGIFVLGVALYVVMVLIGIAFGLSSDVARLLALAGCSPISLWSWSSSGNAAISGKDTTMSDQEEREEQLDSSRSPRRATVTSAPPSPRRVHTD